jgi:hypothetical protein
MTVTEARVQLERLAFRYASQPSRRHLDDLGKGAKLLLAARVREAQGHEDPVQLKLDLPEKEHA